VSGATAAQSECVPLQTEHTGTYGASRPLPLVSTPPVGAGRGPVGRPATTATPASTTPPSHTATPSATTPPRRLRHLPRRLRLPQRRLAPPRNPRSYHATTHGPLALTSIYQRPVWRRPRRDDHPDPTPAFNPPTPVPPSPTAPHLYAPPPAPPTTNPPDQST
jgi:hypothetical protein